MIYYIGKGVKNVKIGEKIKLRRIEHGWSLQDLANRMGYANKSTITRIESGQIDPPQSKVVKFAEALNTTVADLMGWYDEIEKNPVEAAERHFEILIDADIAEMFEEFKTLDSTKRKIVKDLVHSLAETQKTEV